MAIPQLTPDEVLSMSRREKDQWWLTNVFRGDMAQLTIRSAITGFILGGLLSATNLYIGAKTGWTLGVGLTSVILAFAMFKVLSTFQIVKDFTILENNAMQSVATSAGYMTGPLVSGLTAYMMVKNEVMPWWQLMVFNVILSILGVLVAFPMKRRFINDEQQPFPEGRACGVLLDTLYTSDAAVGLFKARSLAFAALFAGTIKFLIGESYHVWIQIKLLGLDTARFFLEHPLDVYFNAAAKHGWWIPNLGGIDIRKLDLNPSINLEMFGAGGLMNIRYGTNMLAGMILTWAVCMPFIVNAGDTSSSKGQTYTLVSTIEPGKNFKVSTKDYSLPVAIGVAKGNLQTVEGDKPKATPIRPRIVVDASGVRDEFGTLLPAPIELKKGTYLPATGTNMADAAKVESVKVANLRIDPTRPIKVGETEIAFPATFLVEQGEDRSGAPILAVVNATAGGFTDFEGKPLAGNLEFLAGEVRTPAGARDRYETNFNRAALLNSWGLWPGVAMLVCASMAALFAKPKVIFDAIRGVFNKKSAADSGTDVLSHIEVPLWISFVGIPIVGAIGVWAAHAWFDVSWVWGALSIPLIIVLTLIAAQATALTSITPTGSLSKITQFTFGALDRQFPRLIDAAGKGVPNPAVNLMTACMTTEVSSNAANLLMDIKPGYMLGAKPRQQAIGHIIGIVSGALASAPLFYILFLAGHKDNPFVAADPARAKETVEQFILQDPDKFSFTGAVQWRGVSQLITNGLSSLPASALWAMAFAAVFGAGFEIWRVVTKSKVPISPLAIGLGIVLPPDSTIWMFLGAAFFWVMHKIYKNRQKSLGHRLWIETHEPICAGLIAGAALIGIGDMLVKVFVLK